MITISLSFPSGRFHATPWSRHVNEATPEWPPSPWRLLRSLIAVWKRKCPEMETAIIESVLRQLAMPPHFSLPPASTGHSRHYMPWFKKGPDDKTLVFDTFVAISKQANVHAIWPQAELDTAQRTVLKTLLDNLGFLGRAEAWCEAGLLETTSNESNCIPLNGQSVPEGFEIVRMLCVDVDTAFGDDHVMQVTSKTSGRGKNKVTEEIRTSLYDPAWNLCIETLQMHKEKWSDPPGSQWVSYIRPSDCFKVQRTARIRQRKRPRMQIARFALDSTVLPLVTDTLPIAESARRALMGIYGRIHKQPDEAKGQSATFSGKDKEGNKRIEPHQHAFYLPTDEDGDGRLDHLTIVAEEGFGSGELKAIDRLSTLKTFKRDASGHTLYTVLLGLGRIEDYTPGPLAESGVWISATPFIAPRHPKRTGKHRDDPKFWWERSDKELQKLRNEGKRASKHVFIDKIGWLEIVIREELERLLNRRADLSDIEINSINIRSLIDDACVAQIGQRKLRPIQFKRYRQKSGDDGGSRLSGAYEITFPKPIRGPICLGHSSHFGLGLFIPK